MIPNQEPLRMKRAKRATVIMLAGFFCGLVSFAHAVTYNYDYQNRVTEVHYDDGSWVAYIYDENGNTTIKAYPGDQASFPVRGTAGPGGAVSPAVANVAYGGSASFTITPSTGYHLLDVLVDGQSVGAVSSHTFTDVKTAHNLHARFEINTYVITASVGGSNGTISPGSATVRYGASQTFSFIPGTGYHVSDVLVDGSSIGPVASYTFTNVDATHTVQASFAINTYVITTSVTGSGGSIDPGAIVNYGDNRTFNITPASGYYVSDVLADGISRGPISSYTFTNVTADHTLSASFTNTPVKNLRTNSLYSTLQAAYNAASDGDTILCRNFRIAENFSANRNISVTIDGGYVPDFGSNPGMTTIAGAPVISSGTVTWKNFIISN